MELWFSAQARTEPPRDHHATTFGPKTQSSANMGRERLEVLSVAQNCTDSRKVPLKFRGISWDFVGFRGPWFFFRGHWKPRLFRPYIFRGAPKPPRLQCCFFRGIPLKFRGISWDFGGGARLSWVRPFVTFSHCQTFFGGICDFKQDFHTGSHSGDNITLPSLFCLFGDTQQIFHTANPLSVISSHCQTSCCCFWEFVQKQPSHNHNSAFYDVQTRFLPFKASTLTKKLFLEANEFFSQLRAPHVSLADFLQVLQQSLGASSSTQQSLTQWTMFLVFPVKPMR